MAQTYTADVYDGTHTAATDLQNMENNFAALKSSFSGASQPSNAIAGMLWFDTTKKAMKQRNTANSAWLGLMHGDTSQKMWVYRNSAMDGWAVDSTPSDRVLAVKGGSTYTTGASGQGTWSISGLGHTHTPGTLTGGSHAHQWYNETNATTNDQMYDSSGNEINLTGVLSLRGATQKSGSIYGVEYNQLDVINLDSGYGLKDIGVKTNTVSISGSTATGTPTTSTWRPAASVGTIQYLDL